VPAFLLPGGGNLQPHLFIVYCLIGPVCHVARPSIRVTVLSSIAKWERAACIANGPGAGGFRNTRIAGKKKARSDKPTGPEVLGEDA